MTPDVEVDARAGAGEPPPSRSVAVAAVAGVAAAAVLFLIVASLFTIPLFALARFTEPGHGTDREWFREGLRWAVLGGAVVALACGAGLAWWLRRGGRIPQAPRPWETE